MRKGNETTPILLIDDFESIKPQLQSLNSTMRKIVLSQDTDKEIVDELVAMNYAIVNKTPDEMKPTLRLSQEGQLSLSYWSAANLLSAPLLSPEITNGRINQFYEINGYAPQVLSLDAKKEYAMNEGKRLKSILSGGALPVQIIIGTPTSIPPYLGEEFLKYSAIGAVASALAVSFIIFLRYRDLKLVLPIIATILLEMTLTLSVVGTVLGTIDLAVMAGVIGATGTGVNDQIIITDELLHRKKGDEEESAKLGIARAFFIVLTVASISIIAMFPLLFSGLVEIMGYALSVIVEVLIGATITRPAFGAVMEKLLG